ncbi:hypothetical protein KUF71_001013 [Frankliniella fusca]|uniref:RNA-directed DNA polymerase n=1 Tax=Frankliniella fusca TaxID=407009 RepID=A0AAE1LHH6_9NEOP|nr:hypothetical protein KUF71_001013 [Frankliniella fusca]
MLALSFPADKFEKFIWGMPAITNNRLKKLKIKLMRFQLALEYLPGKLMTIADLLSRQTLQDPVEDEQEIIEYVREVTKYISLSSDFKMDLRRETGWPDEKQNVQIKAKQYWQVRHELFMEDNLIIKTDRIVIPESLRQEVLLKLHVAHLGIVKTKAKARQSVHWPEMSNGMSNMVQGCRACERHNAANHYDPLTPHDIPDWPYQKVGADILDWEGKPYLVVVDYLSKWIEVRKLPRKSSKSVNDSSLSIFTTYGIPETLFGDNNPLNSRVS